MYYYLLTGRQHDLRIDRIMKHSNDNDTKTLQLLTLNKRKTLIGFTKQLQSDN